MSELKTLLADLFKHYKESHEVQDILTDGDRVSCYGCSVEVRYDDLMKEWPPLIHKEDCPTIVMGTRIKTFLQSQSEK